MKNIMPYGARSFFAALAPNVSARLIGKALGLAMTLAFALSYGAQSANAQRGYGTIDPFEEEMREWFGYHWWDLPRFGDYHYILEQENYRHDSIISTGFDPATGCNGMEAEVPNFGELTQINSNTQFAHDVLIREYGSPEAAADVYASWTADNQAVYLNTMAAIAAQGIPTSQVRFEGFYMQDNGIAGVILSNVTSLGSMVQAGDSYRSPSYVATGSLEATPVAGVAGMYKFDVDIWNPIGPGAALHMIEVGQNHINNEVTHPIDAARALAFRGVSSGINPRCRVA